MPQQFPLLLPQFSMWQVVNNENKMVGSCVSMIPPLTSCHVVKLWQNYENNCGTRFILKR